MTSPIWTIFVAQLHMAIAGLQPEATSPLPHMHIAVRSQSLRVHYEIWKYHQSTGGTTTKVLAKAHAKVLQSLMVRCCVVVLQPSITSSAQYVVTHNPQPQFLVDYGEKVQQLDPLQLFNISGTDRCALPSRLPRPCPRDRAGGEGVVCSSRVLVISICNTIFGARHLAHHCQT